MPDVTFADVADVISVVAGLMTILGVGGLVSWSFIQKQRGTLADNSVSIFAFSVKTGLCILLLWPTSLVFFALHVFVVLSLGPGVISGSDFFWHPEHPLAYLASYVLNVLLWVPLYILLCACTYTWSFGPFRIFSRSIRGANPSP